MSVKNFHVRFLCVLVCSLGMVYTWPAGGLERRSLFSCVRSFCSRLPSCKKLLTGAACAGAGYWVTRAILQYGAKRHDIVEYPSHDTTLVCGGDRSADGERRKERRVRVATTLDITTNGAVVVTAGHEGVIRVDHEYGASWRTDMQSISFSERLDGHTNTLTVMGNLGQPRKRCWQCFLEKFFCFASQRRLRHRIEVPPHTDIIINSQRPASSMRERTNTVSCRGITGSMTVTTDNPEGVHYDQPQSHRGNVYINGQLRPFKLEEGYGNRHPGRVVEQRRR